MPIPTLPVPLLSGKDLDRFLANVLVGGDGCWIWQGAKRAKKYGHLRVQGKQPAAHRLSYRLLAGPVPDGMLVCHHCDTPLCVRPSHLFLGSPKDNSQDASEKGRINGQQKTHCPKGHPYSGDNLYLRPPSRWQKVNRMCRTCMRANTRRWRAEKKKILAQE